MASNDIKLNTVYNEDSRHLNKFLNKQIVDVTITSPPYFDLKDYGHKMQIGFGQEYSKYLEDLKIVFKNIYDCTKDSGSLWVIIDSFRKNNEVTPLPFDFSNKLKEIGWKLQEVIIWEKDRTVPWTHKGQMRNLFEYILLFSKNDKYNFFIDEVRDISTLKKWWVKYPERYNPKGKTPDGLWKFDIPTQGSWGSGYIRHFCPLPEEMIGQILKISSKEGDIVRFKPLVKFEGQDTLFRIWRNSKKANLKSKKDDFDVLKAYKQFCAQQVKYIFIGLKQNIEKANWTMDRNNSNAILNVTTINGVINCLRLLIENDTYGDIDYYKEKFKSIEGFKFKKYKSSQYRKMGKDIFDRCFK